MSGAQTLNIDNGPVPVTQQIDKTGQDALSPTTMVLNYLKERGFQPSSENVRRALEANARDPGVIEGLRSDTAGSNPLGAAASSGAGMPTPPVPPTLEHTNQPTPAVAPTADAGGGGMDLSALILGLLGVPGAARALGPKPTAIPGVGPDMLAPAPQLEAPPKQLAAPVKQLEAPAKQITGPPAPNEAPVAKPGEVIARPDESGTKKAIDKAVPDEPAKPKRARAKARARL